MAIGDVRAARRLRGRPDPGTRRPAGHGRARAREGPRPVAAAGLVHGRPRLRPPGAGRRGVPGGWPPAARPSACSWWWPASTACWWPARCRAVGSRSWPWAPSWWVPGWPPAADGPTGPGTGPTRGGTPEWLVSASGVAVVVGCMVAAGVLGVPGLQFVRLPAGARRRCPLAGRRRDPGRPAAGLGRPRSSGAGPSAVAAAARRPDRAARRPSGGPPRRRQRSPGGRRRDPVRGRLLHLRRGRPSHARPGRPGRRRGRAVRRGGTDRIGQDDAAAGRQRPGAPLHRWAPVGRGHWSTAAPPGTSRPGSSPTWSAWWGRTRRPAS